MQLLFLITIAVCWLVLVCAASSGAGQESAAPPLPEAAKRLEAWVGTWDAEVTMMGSTTQGSETCRIDCGGHWLVTEHTGSFMGMPFLGKGFTGFDATKDAYAGVWIDSTGAPMAVFGDGRFAKDGKSFTAHVDGVGMDGKPARFEYVSTFPDARARTFEVFQIDGARRESQMKIRYTKRG